MGGCPARYPAGMADPGMRATWDAAATADPELLAVYVGPPATGPEELEGLYGRLGADPRGGTCVEVGCGPGRMTGRLAARFDRVIAVDVSDAMLRRAREAIPDGRVEFRRVGGERLDTVEDGVADAVLCYLVLQHLPSRRIVATYLREFARVLRPGGTAVVQLPVLVDGLVARLWRLARSAAVPLTSRLRTDVTEQAAYRGTRLTGGELARALDAAGLRVVRRDESDTSPYRHAREVFLLLERA